MNGCHKNHLIFSDDQMLDHGKFALSTLHTHRHTHLRLLYNKDNLDINIKISIYHWKVTILFPLPFDSLIRQYKFSLLLAHKHFPSRFPASLQEKSWTQFYFFMREKGGQIFPLIWKIYNFFPVPIFFCKKDKWKTSLRDDILTINK